MGIPRETPWIISGLAIAIAIAAIVWPSGPNKESQSASTTTISIRLEGQTPTIIASSSSSTTSIPTTTTIAPTTAPTAKPTPTPTTTPKPPTTTALPYCGTVSDVSISVNASGSGDLITVSYQVINNSRGFADVIFGYNAIVNNQGDYARIQYQAREWLSPGESASKTFIDNFDPPEFIAEGAEIVSNSTIISEYLPNGTQICRKA